MKTPKPVVTETVCDICGLDWERHGDKPSLRDCVELLRTELAMRPILVPQPYYLNQSPYPQMGSDVWCAADNGVQATYLGPPAEGWEDPE